MSQNPPPSTEDIARFLDLIWKDQDGWFELSAVESKRNHLDKDRALASLAGMNYFAPLARTSKGFKKADVADTGNVLWADIDRRDAPTLVEERLEPLGLLPSAFVCSAKKGYWVYLKLDRQIPTDEIELLNRRLALLLDADSRWARNQLARLPGSYRVETDSYAYVVSQAGHLYDPAVVAARLPVLPVSNKQTDPGGSDQAISDQSLSQVLLPPDEISAYLRNYISRRPNKNEGYDRSEMEFSVFLSLYWQGWSDAQIIKFASMSRLPRHTEEYRRHRDYRWTERSLRKIRTQHGDVPSLISNRNMCDQSEHSRQINLREVLRFAKTNDGFVLADLQTEFECSYSTSRRATRRLIVADYLSRCRRSRREVHSLTPRGESIVASRFEMVIAVPRASTPTNKTILVAR